MNQNCFDVSKLHESIFGTDQRWKPNPGVDAAPWRLPDEWSAIAWSNKEAADRLVDGLGRGPLVELYMSYPIMFLYRHYVETMLKGLRRQLWECKRLMAIWAGESFTQPRLRYDHNLVRLWEEVRASLIQVDERIAGEGAALDESNALYDAIESRIREFVEIDEKGISFRYPEDQKGQPTLGVPLYKKELLQVKGVVDALEFHFGGISCGVDDTSSSICEALHSDA